MVCAVIFVLVIQTTPNTLRREIPPATDTPATLRKTFKKVVFAV
jgi:hypothetical protein